MVAAWEEGLREEEDVTNTLERGHSELSSLEADLNTRETALEADQRSLGDLRTEVLARELSTQLKASQLAFWEKELADKEKRLAEMQVQELVAARKRLEELQAARAIEEQRVWDFLGKIETALVPLGFSPLHSRDPVQEVSTVLPLLDATGAKMLKLDEAISKQVELEGRALAEMVMEHGLMCFRN
jgi:hypothetical protein